MEQNLRAATLPAPIPNAGGQGLLEGALSLQVKLTVMDTEDFKEKIVTRSFDNLNAQAEAKAIREFAELVAQYTNCDGLSDCIVIHKTFIEA